MAEIWAAATATVVVGAYSANQQAKAGQAAANAQQRAADAATAEQQRQFDLTREDQRPWIEAGQNALNLQKQFLAGDTSGFDKAPDYAWAVDQGTKSLDRGAAAAGNLWGGGADADRIKLGQGLATQYANNYWNKLAGMAGQGQSGAQNLGMLGVTTANNIGNNLADAAAARSSSYANTANAWSNFGNQAAGAFGNWYGNLGSDANGKYLGNQRGPG